MELIKQNTQTKIIKSLLVILLGSIILAISSKIKIPFYPVPMTMQTFVVLFLGISFGWKIGLATISLYLFQGIIGLPVFAGTPEKGMGLIYFTGPTMGYLIGFLLAVYSAGIHKDLINFKNYKLYVLKKQMAAMAALFLYNNYNITKTITNECLLNLVSITKRGFE